MSHLTNTGRIKVVYHALGNLAKGVTFVGGATVSLYRDRPAADIRPTDDVDILVEVIDYKGFANLEETLRSKGFTNDVESKVICRYRIKGITVDVMPTDKKILGFGNSWYPDGHANAIAVTIDETCSVNIFLPVYFLATKIEAFNGRGKGDGRTSSDFEDIVYMLNNRNAIWDELDATNGYLREWLKSEIGVMINNKYLFEWVTAHLDYQEQKRAEGIISRLIKFSNSK